MKTSPFVVAMAFSILLVGCGGEKSDVEIALEESAANVGTPEVALNGMLEFAEAGDWENYVDTYYGEKDKFRSDADRDQVVARFRDKWGSAVVEQLGAIKNVPAEIIDDGNRASFATPDGNAFYLYKDGDGNWTFHL